MSDQRFNLLPHRQMEKEFARNVLLRQVGFVAALAVAFSMLLSGWMHAKLSDEIATTRTIEKAIGVLLPDYQQALRLQARYGQLLQRQKLIETLDARRSTSVLLLSDVADALPGQIYLTKFLENGEEFSIEGRAVESAHVAKFMEQLAASQYLVGVTLNEIRSQEQDADAPFQFLISARIRLVDQLPSGVSADQLSQ